MENAPAGRPKSGDQLPLETPRLLLRRLVPGDAAIVLELSNEMAARTWLPSQVCKDQAHAASVVGSLIRAYEDPGNPKLGGYVLAVEHRADGALIGHVGFSPLDDEIEIGFAVAQNYHGRGLGTEAIMAASRWALRVFALDRILGVTSTANAASKRTLERADFVHEEDRVMRFQGVEQEVSVYVLRGGGHAMEAAPKGEAS